MYAIILECSLIWFRPSAMNPISMLNYRYPETIEGFTRSRLSGVWDEALANTRMKLPIPETWETQLSMKGNKGHVWEELIGKLSY